MFSITCCCIPLVSKVKSQLIFTGETIRTTIFQIRSQDITAKVQEFRSDYIPATGTSTAF